MSLRRIPASGRSYHLISYDKRGVELTEEDGALGSAVALDALADPAAAITDVFVLSHGWQGDHSDAIAQYDSWIGTVDPDARGDSIRPFVIGVHWPSKAWSNRELKSVQTGLLSDETEDAVAVTVEDAVDEYAVLLSDTPEVRAALTTILVHAASVDPDRDASAADSLPSHVADAYRVLAGAADTHPGDDALLGSGWDPDAAFAEAVMPVADDGLLGEGWFSKLREAILTPLRQLTFWHSKNQAREFGESGAADLVRAILAATAPSVRVHLMGHSFGTIVMAGAVRGPGARAVPPGRPVSSLLLVQGAVSLWAFAAMAPVEYGGGRGYFADIVDPRFVDGPIVVTRSRWDYAVGRFYPLAVRLAGQFLLDADAPKYGGLGAHGAHGVDGAVELPRLEPGGRYHRMLSGHGIYNVDASDVIARLDGAAGAHSDLAHPELAWLAWDAALARGRDADPD